MKAAPVSLTGMSKQSPRRAAQERVSAYHEARLGELIGHVREALDRFSAGGLDAFEADQAIFQYSRAAKELWKFCNLTNVEFTASLIEDGGPTDWWERGASSPAIAEPGASSQSSGCGLTGMPATGCSKVMNSSQLVPMGPEFGDAELRLAVAAYLARFKGQSRLHNESDLRCYLTWCGDHDLHPLHARRPHVELYLRWMQEVRGFQPSTVSRRLSVLAGFYRTCVIDAVLEHSPAEYVRRPHVSTDSPTLGLSHLQFEALLTAARDSTNPHDFALVAMLGLLGLRIFEATGADITDLSEVHGHRVLTVVGKGDKLAMLPLPPAVSRAIDRAAQGHLDGPILRNRAGTQCRAIRLPTDCAAWPPPPAWPWPGCIPTCSGTPTSPPCSTPASISATFRSPPATPTLEPP